MADLTIVSWVLMVGYCICGISRKSQYPASAPKLLTSATSVSVHGGGYHVWEVTSSEVTQFLKVCAMHCCLVIAADKGRTGRVCCDNFLRPNDLDNQAEPSLLDRTRLRAFQEKGTSHLCPWSHIDHLLYHILDLEDPNLLANLCLLAPGDG